MAKSALVVCLVLLSLHGVLAAGLYGKNTNVIQLTKDNFAEVFTSPGVWLVEFYAPWCGHCKNLAPAWEEAATRLKGTVNVAAVNCDEHKELAGLFGVQGFPTIKFFGSEQSKNPPSQVPKGMPWKDPQDYPGARDAASIVKFALSKLPNNVVSGKKLDEFISSTSEHPKVLLFSDKSSTPNLYKAVALEYKGRLGFAQVSNTNTDLVSKYNVESFPTLVIDLGDSHEVFQGKFVREDLDKFLAPHAGPAPTQSNSNSNANSNKKSTASSNEPVVLRQIETRENYEEWCTGKTGTCAIAVFDTEDNLDTYTAAFTAAMNKLQGKFKWFWIDGKAHPEFLQSLHIDSGFPQLVALNAKRLTLGQFIGAFEEKNIVDFLDSVLLGSRRLIQKLDAVPNFS